MSIDQTGRPSSGYPLTWPQDWPRTNGEDRTDGRFSNRKTSDYSTSYKVSKAITLAVGVERVLAELRMVKVKSADVIISTDVEMRLDGLPRAGRKAPDDPGVGVYWTAADGERLVMAIDIYTDVAQNLGAIAATLGALRAIERHGSAQISNKAYTGFKQLSAPKTEKHWTETLGKHDSLASAKAAYRELASRAHPDKGGSENQMAEINKAWALAKEALS